MFKKTGDATPIGEAFEVEEKSDTLPAPPPKHEACVNMPRAPKVPHTDADQFS